MALVRTIKLLVQYDGTLFHGWQRQKSLRTIQQCLEDALFTILQNRVDVVGAGRTDAGVHAWGQVAHFCTASSIATSSLVKALNSFLSWDVRVCAAWDVDQSFHARFSARKREYVYVIYCGEVCPPFYARYVNHVWGAIDLSRLRETMFLFCGEHDFTSFCSADDPHENKCCVVYKARVVQKGKLIIASIQANRFLRKMVRMLMGFALNVNNRDLDINMEVSRLLVLKNRRAHQYPTACSRGLFLRRVCY